jgi:hypothetical protein
MGRVYLEIKDNQWEEKENSNFWIDEALLNKLKSVEMIREKGWDAVLVVDGKERSGKSVLGMVMAWYLSKGKLTLDNFARGLSDAAEKIARLPDKSVLILDEASTVFASKDSMTEEGKQLIKIMDIVGQKNMVFILCLPSFFDLNKTMAVRRSLFLCHVYPDEAYNRGRYMFFGEKRKAYLYTEGKKRNDSYKVTDADFVGEYMDFEPPFYQEYKEIVKKESLKEVLSNAINTNQWKNSHTAVRNREAVIAYKLKYVLNLKINQIKEIMGLSDQAIYERINLFKEQNMIKEAPVSQISPPSDEFI